MDDSLHLIRFLCNLAMIHIRHITVSGTVVQLRLAIGTVLAFNLRILFTTHSCSFGVQVLLILFLY